MANTKSVVQQDQELPNMELPEGAVVRVHRKNATSRVRSHSRGCCLPYWYPACVWRFFITTCT